MKTSIYTNAWKGSAPNLLNWNKFVVIKYKYCTLMFVKNAAAFQKFTIEPEKGHTFKYKK